MDKGYETVYHILPEVKDAEDYLLNFGEYKWYDVHNQLPLYVETEEDIRYSENDILISEDYRFYIYFNTFAEKITQSKKFNMKFSFPIYYQREYIAQNNTGYHCIKCNCDYSYDYEVKKQPGKWICPNCSTKNSCYKDYQFIQKTFPSEEDMK